MLLHLPVPLHHGSVPSMLSLPQDGPWVLATARLLPGGLKQYFSAPLSVVAPPHPYPDFVMQPLALPRGCDTPVAANLVAPNSQGQGVDSPKVEASNDLQIQ
ncbi:hypothetical protein BKA83DRAFT_4481330 [Pisolithus microcarpus]|nr:hypothetical protein BKA83DRAFT_4481330 [Pisolithus microcarpus]